MKNAAKDFKQKIFCVEIHTKQTKTFTHKQLKGELMGKILKQNIVVAFLRL
jgi:hypothetical protein